MTEHEIKSIMNNARRVMQSRSKFALFCTDLCRDLYGMVPTENKKEEYQKFWEIYEAQRVIQE